jgi:hypothetical protein
MTVTISVKSSGKFSCMFLLKLPRKRNFIAIYDEYGKIIDVVRSKSCLLSV